ncbi:MAG: hypothetical protein OXD43_14335 [Bacteroidetes bacterium]|nr:hypothetical protein [Bacteroidota bacterium]
MPNLRPDLVNTRSGGAYASDSVPCRDLFDGADGLGEEFASATDEYGRPRFSIAASVEKDFKACETLHLLRFFRAFQAGAVPEEYYACLDEVIMQQALDRQFPHESAKTPKKTLPKTGTGKVRPFTSLPVTKLSLVKRTFKAVHGTDIAFTPCSGRCTWGRSATTMVRYAHIFRGRHSR